MSPVVLLAKTFVIVLYDPVTGKARVVKAIYFLYLDENGNWRVNPEMEFDIINYICHRPLDIEYIINIPYNRFEQRTQTYCQFLETPEVKDAIAQLVESEFIRACSI
jgi:hypothetical protein